MGSRPPWAQSVALLAYAAGDGSRAEILGRGGIGALTQEDAPRVIVYQAAVGAN
jgi:hypothetical protein